MKKTATHKTLLSSRNIKRLKVKQDPLPLPASISYLEPTCGVPRQVSSGNSHSTIIPTCIADIQKPFYLPSYFA